MIFLLSPAKSLDMTPVHTDTMTTPRLQAQTEELVGLLRQKTTGDLKQLMSISDALAELNVQRYRGFAPTYTPDHAKQAMLAFTGDVYQGLDASDFSAAELAYAQAHIRILSGLYGVLRPLDLMQAYRLEMGTKLVTDKGKNLYDFWGNAITELLNADLAVLGSPAVFVNLASNEYFKSVNRKALAGRLINVDFKEERDGQYKVISFYAKKARGLMCRFAAKHGIDDPEHLKGFDSEGYAFNAALSTDAHWIFTR